MPLSPLDIKKKTFRKVLRGCDENEVTNFLEQVAEEFEHVFGSQRELQQKIIELEKQLAQYTLLEKNIQQALVQAQDAATRTAESATREADVKLREAELSAQKTLEDARREAERIIEAFKGEAAKLTEDINELRSLRSNMITRIKTLMTSQIQVLNSLEAKEDNTEHEKETPNFLNMPIDDILKSLE